MEAIASRLEEIGRGLIQVQQRIWDLEMETNRQLVYDFIELPDIIQRAIARSLGIAKEGDDKLNDVDRRTAYFRRAQEAGLLERLRQKVKEQLEELN